MLVISYRSVTVHSIKIYVPWFEKFLFESTKCDEFFKKEVRGRKVMECTLITLLMPTPIWHKCEHARCFYQCHDLPFDGVCDLQVDLGHFLKDVAVALLSILNCFPQENFRATLSYSQPFPIIGYLRKQHKSPFLYIFHLIVNVRF